MAGACPKGSGHLSLWDLCTRCGDKLPDVHARKAGFSVRGDNCDANFPVAGFADGGEDLLAVGGGGALERLEGTKQLNERGANEGETRFGRAGVALAGEEFAEAAAGLAFPGADAEDDACGGA